MLDSELAMHFSITVTWCWYYGWYWLHLHSVCPLLINSMFIRGPQKRISFLHDLQHFCSCVFKICCAFLYAVCVLENWCFLISQKSPRVSRSQSRASTMFELKAVFLFPFNAMCGNHVIMYSLWCSCSCCYVSNFIPLRRRGALSISCLGPKKWLIFT